MIQVMSPSIIIDMIFEMSSPSAIFIFYIYIFLYCFIPVFVAAKLCFFCVCVLLMSDHIELFSTSEKKGRDRLSYIFATCSLASIIRT